MTLSRRGTLLIIVAGLSAMLATLGATYLSSLRSRSRESGRNYVDAQARLLLYAACAFITERGGIISAGSEIAFPFYSPETSTDLASASTLNLVAEDCPSDTWFRVHQVDASTFTVTVGIGLTRGVRNATEASQVDAAVREAVGMPDFGASGDLTALSRSEHREYFQVTWTSPHITGITRLSTVPGTW